MIAEINKEILEALELKLKADEGIEFIEALWDLGIVPEDQVAWVSSEEILSNVNKAIKEEEKYPKSEAECLQEIEEICKEAKAIYDNDNFFEDDRDRFMGEASIAEDVLEVIGQYKYMVNKQRIIDSEKCHAVNVDY